MGYPLKRSALYSLFECIFKAQATKKNDEYYAKDYLKVLSHPLIKNLRFFPNPSITRVLVHKIEEVIVGIEKTSLEVHKKEGKWVLPSMSNFPVATEKVEQVLKHLVEAKRSWPMGNTKMAAKQFEVTDEKFERKFSFYTGDKLAGTLYLGNSPSYRKVYARIDQDDKTYSVEFNTVDAPTTAKDWAEHNLYKLDRSKVAHIKFHDFTLDREGAAFVLSGLNSEEVTNATEADNFFAKVQNPYFEDVMMSYDGAIKLLEYSVTNDDKTERQYTYFAMKEDASLAPLAATTKEAGQTPQDEFAVLKVSDFPYYFKIRKARVDELAKFTRATFVKKKDAVQNHPGISKEAGQINTPASNGPG
jgi:hypothetical protein